MKALRSDTIRVKFRDIMTVMTTILTDVSICIYLSLKCHDTLDVVADTQNGASVSVASLQQFVFPC